MWVKTLPFLVGNVDNYQYKNYNLWQNLIHMRMSCGGNLFCRSLLRINKK
jgi:hypothetical protein